jgi:hypothetical protein
MFCYVSLIHLSCILNCSKHNRSEMVAVLGPNGALPYYMHTYVYIYLILYVRLKSVVFSLNLSMMRIQVSAFIKINDFIY